MVLMSRGRKWSLMPLLAIVVFFLQTTVLAQEQANSAFKELRQILKIENPTDKIAALKDFVVKYPETKNKLRAYSTILDTYRSNLQDVQQAEIFAREILAKENDLKLRQLAYDNLLSIYQETDGNKLTDLARKMIQTESEPVLLGNAYANLDEYYSQSEPTKLLSLAEEMMRTNLIDGMIFNNLAWNLIDSEINPQLGLKLVFQGEKLLTSENLKKLYPDLPEDRIPEYLQRTRGYLKDTIGWGYFKTGQNDLAIKALEEALVLYGEPDPEVNMHLGTVLAKQGQKERAIAALTSSLITSSSEKGLELLAETMSKTTDEAEAYLLEQHFATAKTAENFTLIDLNGQSHTLSNYRGKVVMVNFFSPT